MKGALKHSHKFNVSFSKLTIGFTCLAFAYLFKVLIVFIVVQGDGQCLHNFWLGNDEYFNPFFLTVFSVSLFLFLGIIKLLLPVFKGNFQKGNSFFYLFLCIVMGVWMHSLYGLWQTFEYEKGNITVEDYYTEELLQYLFIGNEQSPHECISGI